MKETAEEKKERQRLMGVARKQKSRAKLRALGLPISGHVREAKFSGTNNTAEWFAYYKETFSCQICGESCSTVLDFHHLDPKMKIDNISRLVATDKPMVVILAEIAKCVCLCRNCYAKVHAGLLKL
jgi:hypothetical protein